MKTSMRLALPPVCDWFTCPMSYITSAEVKDQAYTKANNISIIIGNLSLEVSAYTCSSTRRHLENNVEWYICITATDKIPLGTTLFVCQYGDNPIATENLEQGWLYYNGDSLTLRVSHADGYTSIIKAVIENGKLSVEEIA